MPTPPKPKSARAVFNVLVRRTWSLFLHNRDRWHSPTKRYVRHRQEKHWKTIQATKHAAAAQKRLAQWNKAAFQASRQAH